ncbi:hypothetical protein DV737_g3940, partial [Chaetothyriales sp. CBS 132003]
MSEGKATQRAQNLEQNYDKNVDGPTDPDELSKLKLTGNAAPGSHSALFGLTPDGKVHTETFNSTAAPTHSTATTVGGGRQTTSDGETGNTPSTAASGAGVAEQIHDPRVAQKAHGRDVDESTGASGGAGAGSTAGSQGSGNVGAQEGGGSLLDTVKSYFPGSS